MSNPTKGRRSWSLPPKLMKSTKLVSTCEGSRFNDWGARDYVEHVYRAYTLWMWHHRRAATDIAPAIRPC